MSGRPLLPAALLDPAIYPHCAPGPALIETHISWIVLAGEYAYKIKKPVRFAFLDYSTVEARRTACHVEVELNRRWAQHLYLGVAELVMTPAGPRFDAAGAGIEPAVRMRRFDRTQELDALLLRGDVGAAELGQLGSAIAHWQIASPAVDPATAWGTPAEALAAVHENLETLLQPGLPLPSAQLNALGTWIAREHRSIAPLLAARRDAGRVRECHGDLHSRNVVRLDRRLTPFDGIDFAARLRFIDVASDVAFLAMDLERLDRADLAAAFFDAWLSASGDYEAAGVWRWFLVYRALVRAKVDALRAQQLPAGAAAEAAWSECRRFVAVADRYATRGPGLIVITCGPSGSGKSQLSASLVPELPAVRIRSDVERKRRAGLAADARSGSGLDAGLYAPDATRRIYAHMISLAAALAAAGVSVIIDATFLEAAERRRAALAAQLAGAPFAVLDCTAPAAVLRERVAARHADPSEATLEVLEHQLGAAPLAAHERAHTVRADTGRPVDAGALAVALRAVAARPGD